MPKVVYKYPLAMAEVSTIEIPYDASIVHVDKQGQTYCIWAEHGVDYPDDNDHKVPVMKQHTFRIFGTGHLIPDGMSHIGSLQDGPFVFHVYEDLR